MRRERRSGDHRRAPLPFLLIVDTDPTRLVAALSDLDGGVAIETATNRGDALRLAALGPELVLLGHHPPALDGLETCRCLIDAADTAEFPLIFVTRVRDDEFERRALGAGAIDVVAETTSAAVLRARVSCHLQLKQKTDLLLELAERDSLTGVANRRAFDRVLEREWRRAGPQSPLSVLMIDVDCFKIVNDRFGHLVGDECLRRLSRCLTLPLRRSSDMLARYGGDEFVALLPGTDQRGARHVAERMCREVEKGAWHRSNGNSELPQVTVSVGCSTAIPAEDASPRLLVSAADEQLYRAKQGGRNRVECRE